MAIVELSSDTQISRSALRSGLLRVISAKLSWRERGKNVERAWKERGTCEEINPFLVR